MTAHQLAQALLVGPDLPVVINGWGSDEGSTFEVTQLTLGASAFSGAGDTPATPRDNMGWQLPRPCIYLQHCAHTPRSKCQIEQAKAALEKMELDRKRLSPRAFAMQYAEIKLITPAETEEMGKRDWTGAEL